MTIYLREKGHRSASFLEGKAEANDIGGMNSFADEELYYLTLQMICAPNASFVNLPPKHRY